MQHMALIILMSVTEKPGWFMDVKCTADLQIVLPKAVFIA